MIILYVNKLFTNKKTILVKSIKIKILMQGYPGHAKTILNFITKMSKNYALIPLRDINIFNATKNKLIRENILNKLQKTMFIQKELYSEKSVFSINKEKILYLTAPEKEPILYLSATKDHFKSKAYSGLIDFYTDFVNFSLEAKELFKNATILSIFHILFVFGKYEMSSPENAIKYCYKFMESFVPLILTEKNQKIYRKSISGKLMSMRQHFLISIFRDKEFDKQLVSEIFNLDLNIIESTIFKGTIGSNKDFMNTISFMGIDHESPILDELASIGGYNRIHSKEQTGQMHVDWLGARAIADNKGVIELLVIYKDAKMFESSPDQGRLHLKPELVYNVKSLNEYITKYSTRIDALKNKFKNDQHLHKLFTNLINKQNQVKKMLQNIPKTSNGLITDMVILGEIDTWVKEFNKIIIDAMKNPEIASKINLGISADPGRADDFIIFYKKYLEEITQKLINEMSDEQVSEFFSSKMNSKNIHFYYTILHKYVEHFPNSDPSLKNLIEEAKKVIEYVFS